MRRSTFPSNPSGRLRAGDMPALAPAFSPIPFSFAVLAAIHDRRFFVQDAAADFIAAGPLGRLGILFQLLMLPHVRVQRFRAIAHKKSAFLNFPTKTSSAVLPTRCARAGLIGAAQEL